MSYYVYIIFSETINRYYVGVAQDLTTRVQNHNSSFYHASHYTNQADDWVLFHFISCNFYQQAIKAMHSNYMLTIASEKQNAARLKHEIPKFYKNPLY